jgi:hypothetical protein
MGAPVKVYAHSASQDCWNRKSDSRNEQKKKKVLPQGKRVLEGFSLAHTTFKKT